MQKKLIAAAVAAMVTGSAFADTTFYGRIDTYAASEKTGKDSRTHVGNGGLGGSFISVKADEDLGGGMKGYLNWQAQFASDTTVLPDATRYVNVGVDTGSTGSIQIGAGFSPVHKNISGFMMTGGPDWTMMGKNTGGWALYNTGIANAVEYIVKAGPVSIDAAIQFSEKTADAAGVSKKDAMEITANYATGPLAVGVGYQNSTSRSAATAASTVWADANGDKVVQTTEVTNTAALAGGTTDIKRALMTVGGSYNFGVAKLAGVYFSDTTSTGAVDKKRSAYELSVAVPVAKGTVSAGVGSHTESSDSSKTFSLDYVHNLGKRTFAYVGYGSVKNADNAAHKFGFNYAAAKNEKATILATGLRHTF